MSHDVTVTQVTSTPLGPGAGRMNTAVIITVQCTCGFYKVYDKTRTAQRAKSRHERLAR